MLEGSVSQQIGVALAYLAPGIHARLWLYWAMCRPTTHIAPFANKQEFFHLSLHLWYR